MKPVEVTYRDGKFHLNQYPGAVAVKELPRSMTSALQSAHLNLNDLRVVLEELALAKEHLATPRLATALWRSAVVRLFRSVKKKSSSRGVVSAEAALAHVPAALGLFAYYEALRDKNVVHDENSFLQAQCLAILNPKEQSPQVADVAVIGVETFPVDAPSLDQLMRLVSEILPYCESQLDAALSHVEDSTRAMSPEALFALPDATYRTPTSAEVGQNRHR